MNRWRKVTRAHVAALHARMTISNESLRALADRAGVNIATASAILTGGQVGSRCLQPLLRAAGIDPDAPAEQLRLEARLIEAAGVLLHGLPRPGCVARRRGGPRIARHHASASC